VVFVPFVAPGEVVEVECVEVKKRLRARLLQFSRPPERVAPACRYFGDCGGCQYQHLDMRPSSGSSTSRFPIVQRLGGLTAR